MSHGRATHHRPRRRLRPSGNRLAERTIRETRPGDTARPKETSRDDGTGFRLYSHSVDRDDDVVDLQGTTASHVDGGIEARDNEEPGCRAPEADAEALVRRAMQRDQRAGPAVGVCGMEPRGPTHDGTVSCGWQVHGGQGRPKLPQRSWRCEERLPPPYPRELVFWPAAAVGCAAALAALAARMALVWREAGREGGRAGGERFRSSCERQPTSKAGGRRPF